MAHNRYIIAAFLLPWLIVILTVWPAEAQVLYGSIVGNVSDPTNAAVPGAVVRITHQETNQSYQTTTNAAGLYRFPTVPSGTYGIVINREGFQPWTQENVILMVNTAVRADAKLQVGTVTGSIRVSAQAAALQTERAEVRHEVTAKSLENLPMPGRNYEQLFVLLPGFSPPINHGSIVTNPSRALSFTANGSPRIGFNVRVDGASAISVWMPFYAAHVPSMESIESVNVATNSFDAEQGLAGGASVSVQTKSGTNSTHGSLFEYHHDNALKAKPWALPPGARKPKAILNQLGGTLGGPIKKDKLFYFVSYEGVLDRQTAGRYGSVPTAAIRQGDMSDSNNPIYDPATGAPDGSGRTPFPGNLIPKSRMEPIVQKIVAITPMPTYPDALANNYYATGGYSFSRHQLATKINWMASDKLSGSGRISWLKFDMSNPTMFGKELGGPPLYTPAFNGGNGFGNTVNSTLSLLYLAKPNLIVDAYFGYTLEDYSLEPWRVHEKIGLGVLGIPGTHGYGPQDGGWPAFSVSGYSDFGLGESNLPIFNRDPQYTYVGNINWTKGAHSLRFGLDSIRQHMNHWEPAGARDRFSFSGGVTAVLRGPSPNQFNSYADFLLGLPSGIAKDAPMERLTSRAWVHSLYIRDQWQVTRKLTLSPGVRWEYFPMPTRANRGMERYDFALNKMLICGIGTVPRDCGVNMSKAYFAPRFGLAYRLTDTFVVRAGYGINYDTFSAARLLLRNYPLLKQLSVLGPSTYRPAGLLRDGIPPIEPLSFGNGLIDIPGSYGITTLRPDRHIRSYLQSWNLTLQKQVKWGFMAQAGYVATRAVHQNGNLNLNVGRVGGGVASMPFYQRYGRSAGVVMITPLGHTDYDSLQATLERRFAGGYQVRAAYTFSKTIGVCCDDYTAGTPAIQLPEYQRLNRSVLPYDRPHNFNLSGIAELPFGSGKRLLRQPGLASRLASGWQLNWILTAYSGEPFSVRSAATSLNAPGNTQRADQVKPKVKILGGTGRGEAYFDPYAFAPVTEARFGTAGFNTLRGPVARNIDLGLFRRFRVTERWSLEVRAEAFNFTNTPHFSPPGDGWNNNVSNLQLNADGTVRRLNGYSEITSTRSYGREGIDERLVRFGLRISF